ncbi:MAG TPA: hypothetical protein PKA51_09905 [Kiritimatiellia bacterium]|nr:hypothetical protein [Kiritimatiellia bacterium]
MMRRTSNDWKFWVLVFPMIGTFWAARADLAQRIVQTNDVAEVARGFGRAEAIFQATTVEFDLYATTNGAPFVFPSGSWAVLEVFDRPNRFAMALTNTLLTAEAGFVGFRAAVTNTSIAAGRYRYTVRAFRVEGGDTLQIAVLGHGELTVKTTPYGAIAGNPPVNGISFVFLAETSGLSNLIWQTFATSDQLADLLPFRIVGGYYHSNWFDLVAEAYGYSVETVTQTQSVNAVRVRHVLVGQEIGYLLTANVTRIGDVSSVVTYLALTNMSISQTWLTNPSLPGQSNQVFVAVWDSTIPEGAIGAVKATLGDAYREASFFYRGPTSTYTKTEFVADEGLRRAINTGLLARAQGQPDLRVYTNGVRNNAAWISGIDVTCVSPFNSLGGGQRAGTAITDRHVLYASHFPLPVGTALTFVDATNGVLIRTIIDCRDVGNDVGVALLDAALPASVTPARLIDVDGIKRFYGYWNYLEGSGMYAFMINQNNQASLILITKPVQSWAVDTALTVRNPGHLTWPGVAVGDSGSPVIMYIDGQAVLIGLAWSTLAISSLPRALPDISAAIDEMGGGASLSIIDLDAYLDYDGIPIPGGAL